MLKCILCDSINLLEGESGKTRYGHDFTYVQCAKCSLIQCLTKSADAEHYESVEYYKDRWEFSAVFKYVEIQPSVKIIEVGCGEGYFSQKLKDKNSCYTGIDFNKNALAVARNRLPDGNFISVDVCDYLPNYFDKLDAFFAFHVLEHFDNPLKILREVSEKLNCNGFIALSVPSDRRFALAKGKREGWDFPPHHLTRWSNLSLTNLAKKINMQVVCIENEPLSFKEYNEFSTMSHFLGKIKNKGLRRSAKFLFYPLILTLYLFSKTQSSGQAKLIIMKKIS